MGSSSPEPRGLGACSLAQAGRPASGSGRGGNRPRGSGTARSVPFRGNAHRRLTGLGPSSRPHSQVRPRTTGRIWEPWKSRAPSRCGQREGWGGGEGRAPRTSAHADPDAQQRDPPLPGSWGWPARYSRPRAREEQRDPGGVGMRMFRGPRGACAGTWGHIRGRTYHIASATAEREITNRQQTHAWRSRLRPPAAVFPPACCPPKGPPSEDRG